MPRIVILGAGHGGLRCANALAGRLKDPSDITVVARDNYFLYYPFLRDLVAGAADLTEVAFPLREVLHPRVRLVVAELDHVDKDARAIHVRLPDGEQANLPYDELVVALGTTTDYHHTEGAREHAIPFKSVDDALAIRLRILDTLESEEGGGKRPSDVVIAGGAYTGLEVAGAIHDLIRRARHVFGSVLTRDAPRIHLVGDDPRLVHRMPDPIPAYVEHVLRARGDDVVLGQKVVSVDSHGASLQDGTKIPSALIVWVAGVAPGAAVKKLPFAKARDGRISVDPMLRVEEGVWALGDCADAKVHGREASMTAQAAEAEADNVAANMWRAASGRKLVPFHHHSQGLIIPLGEGLGAAQVGKSVITGRAAGLMWRSYHMTQLPGAARKARYVTGWLTGAAKQRALLRAPARPRPPTSGRPS